MHIERNELLAIILCGGKSTRMGTDKALKIYHHQPQFLHVKSLINPLTSNVIFSINADQEAYFTNELYAIDHGKWHGPIDGVLSVIAQTKWTHHFLVIGIDYPLLTIADIESLLYNKTESDDVVCYHHSVEDVVEPLVALYDQRCVPLLMQYGHSVPNPSLRHFITTVHTCRINLVKPHNIISFDYENFHHE